MRRGLKLLVALAREEKGRRRARLPDEKGTEIWNTNDAAYVFGACNAPLLLATYKYSEARMSSWWPPRSAGSIDPSARMLPQFFAPHCRIWAHARWVGRDDIPWFFVSQTTKKKVAPSNHFLRRRDLTLGRLGYAHLLAREVDSIFKFCADEDAES